MLSVKECKKHLKGCDFTDEQVEEVRQGLYLLANLFVEEYLKTKVIIEGCKTGNYYLMTLMVLCNDAMLIIARSA